MTTTETAALPRDGGGASPAPDAASKETGNGADATLGVAQGSYELVRRRLLEQAAELARKAESLNERRKQVFGGAELALVANERVRTEHNCVARDIVSVGGNLLFGFQVFLGLKTEIGVSDVFAFYTFRRKDDGEWELAEIPIAQDPSSGTAFLAAEDFVKDLRDTFKYASKDARLLRLKRTDTRLFASVQIGAEVKDAKVFRWTIDASGRIAYMDARGDEEMAPPPQHSFAWTQARREDQVHGPHPHINVLDTVFVETVGGDLTVKVENNTKDGKGIYREPVDDPNQTLDDSDIAWAKVGQLVLLRIKPFREASYRYLVYDAHHRRVTRIDAIGRACHELPEDHGIIFPGGYYLQSGEHKLFEGDVSELEFERVLPSPNGEDVLYVYHARNAGEYLLLPYNVIRKEVASSLRCHGYSLFDDGTMAIFRAVAEPTRVHPLQIWRTPFTTAEFAAAAPKDGSYLAKVGNADLVRGISEMLALRKLASVDKPTRKSYEELARALVRAVDAHYWLGHEEAGNLLTTLGTLRKTCELVLDEFDKADAIEKRAREALDAASAEQKELLERLRVDDFRAVEDYLAALTKLRAQRGKLIALEEVRGIDRGALGKLQTEAQERADEVGKACVAYFLKEGAFRPLLERLDAIVAQIEKASKSSDVQSFAADLDTVQSGLTLLTEVTGNLKVDDPTARTRILEGISEAFAQQNRARAVFAGRKKDLALAEGRAEFGVQFRLFGQSVTGALSLCDSPEACDEQLSKLLLALEELEGKFGEYDEFTADLATKREEVNDALGARRQQLLDERQKRAQNLMVAAERILAGIGRRAAAIGSIEDLNAYFASDAMVQKLGELEEQLRGLGAPVRADEIASRLKSARQDAIRGLRDRTELSGGAHGQVTFGAFAFSVHTQPLELALVPKDGAMTLHLTGTEFFDPIDDPVLEASRDLWDQALVSENAEVYRGEFLACSILFDAEDGRGKTSIESLTEGARDPERLLGLVRAAVEERLDEGYERGVHDADAAKILEKLLFLRASAGLLRYAADARALAWLHWTRLDAEGRTLLHVRAKSLDRLRAEMSYAAAQAALASELEASMAETAKTFGIAARVGEIGAAARYLVLELAGERVRFTASLAAEELHRKLVRFLEENGSRRALEGELAELAKRPAHRFELARAYVAGFVEKTGEAADQPYVREAAVLLLGDRDLSFEPSSAILEAEVTGLLGSHGRIQDRTLRLAVDEVLARLRPFVFEHAARFRAFRKQKAEIALRERERLRMTEFMPRILTSFVRNRLIDRVYLPLIGANLAKQIGALGAKKRTDTMGLLLLVSPPGYGKTTLMEYVASKLGLVFMKVNGPALGHDVTSLDPAEAKSATARQEVEKINLALEMQSNVMLYLDDIQHVSPELLQKFISLCDAQRKIEGVYRGKSRTYDLRGKRFCVVMAGNPYTETGARFQIPDMLANRADTYNLGDILGGQEDLFASSYLENSLTSNPALAPLAMRDPGDIDKLSRIAKGESIPLTDLSYGYSRAEVEEIAAVLKHSFVVERLLLEVNRQYILSASQEDAYRTEPPFKLQGSYRNMNKIIEKVVPAMNAEELERLLDDHYASESQTLTTGAEQNLLKLAEIRGRLTEEQAARLRDIRASYVRNKRTGGPDTDPVTRATGALSGIDERLQRIGEILVGAAKARGDAEKAEAERLASAREEESPLDAVVERLATILREAGRPRVEVRVEDGGRESSATVAEVVREHGRTVERVLSSFTELAQGLAQSRPSGDASSQAGQAGSGAGSAAANFAPKLDELLGTLRALEHRLDTATVSAGQRFDVVLDGASPSNFYRTLESLDVVAHGGVFVATYAKPPMLGTPVVLGLEMPGGVRCEARGVVAFVHDSLGDDLPAGFGVRLTSPSPDTRTLIEQFVRGRDPLLRD